MYCSASFCAPKPALVAIIICLLLRPALSQQYGKIRSTFSQSCSGISAGSINDGASMIQWDCVPIPDQMFSFLSVGDSYQIRAQHSGKCLGLANGSSQWGTPVVQMTCGIQAHKLWKVLGSGSNQMIKATHSGLCMNIEGGVRTRGAKVVQWGCGYPNDKFEIGVSLGISVGGGSTSTWTGPFGMPLVSAAAANLPDGRILAWSAYRRDGFSGTPTGRTYTAIFDPETNQSSEALIQNTDHDMFCPGTAILSDGRILITGGSTAASVTLYDPSSNSWTRENMMNIARAYHSMTVLSDGSVFALGGSWNDRRGYKHAEIWSTTTGQWALKPGIQLQPDSSLLTKDREGIYRADNHMWLFAGPNGKIFHAGPANQMHWIDTSGNGSVTRGKLRGNQDTMNGNAVMYDANKILIVGGAQDYINSPATSRAFTIDISGGVGQEIIEELEGMSSARAMCNSVVLPSGEVVVIGGQTYVEVFQDTNSVLVAEIWSPVTKSFATLPAMSVPRNYHSVAILMMDGRVWVAGSGLCFCGTVNHFNAEILTPPYLLNSDGSPKARSKITQAPNEVKPGDQISVTVDRAGSHSFVLMRLSAVTHSVNNDQRRIPLTATGTGPGQGSFRMEVPNSYSIVLPGTYFLFALDADGVPSVATAVSVKQPNGQPPASGAPNLEFPIVSQLFSGLCVTVNGQSQADGANVDQWTCLGQLNQRFKFESAGQGRYRVKAAHSNKCLAVVGASNADGASVVQLTCEDQAHQLWRIEGTGSNQRLRVSHTNMCLNIAGARKGVGQNLIQWPCVGANNEMWKVSDSLGLAGRTAFQKVTTPQVNSTAVVQTQIRSNLELSGLCVDISGSSFKNGAIATQGRCEESMSQMFAFLHVGDGHYRVVAQHSSKCLGVRHASLTPGAPIVQQRCHDDKDHQLWSVEGLGSGQQMKAKHSNLCLSYFENESGNTLIQEECNNEGHTLWGISDILQG